MSDSSFIGKLFSKKGEKMSKKLGQNRVIIAGGRLSGLAIDTPGEGTHPMGMRERLALFNIIQSYLPDANVMDAYAGSGILGIEALSRDAKHVVFIDNDERAVRTIRRNLADIGVEPNKTDVLKLNVKRIEEIGAETYNIILADPPYDKYTPEMLTILAPFVSAGGLLVASTPVEGPEIMGLETLTRRKYARCHITVYQRSI